MTLASVQSIAISPHRRRGDFKLEEVGVGKRDTFIPPLIAAASFNY
jgi:hypothetical protein